MGLAGKCLSHPRSVLYLLASEGSASCLREYQPGWIKDEILTLRQEIVSCQKQVIELLNRLIEKQDKQLKLVESIVEKEKKKCPSVVESTVKSQMGRYSSSNAKCIL